MTHFPPPPKLPPKVGPLRRFPPAVFPAVLGLLGVVLAWKRGVLVFGLPSAPVEVVEGMVTLLFLFFVAAYAGKAVLRFGAVVEDLNTLPGRTGLAAMAVGFLVLAQYFARRVEAVSATCLVIGCALLVVFVAYVAFHRLRGTDQAGPPTPAMHLIFVGFVVAPGSALPLGVSFGVIEALAVYCVVAVIVTMVLTARPLLTGEGAPPLRPLQVIHLAPPAFLTTIAVMTGHPVLAAVFISWASLVFVLLLVRLAWMIEGGFSGFWSAFTFPVTAYAGALLMFSGMSGASGARMLGGIVLVAVTLYVPVIAIRVLKLWANGALAAKTNASIA